ncbi:ribonuclease VapC [Bacteroidia bacterium]|nr:ribonuclease VapC [Bacteroidia bacterium]
MLYYIDSSAFLKVFFEEELSDFLRNFLKQSSISDTICSSKLLETECRRAAHRAGITQSSISAGLENVMLISATDDIFHNAGIMLPNGNEFLRSLDAIHLATAQYCAVDLFITYDQRQLEAAKALGLIAISPGKSPI